MSAPIPGPLNPPAPLALVADRHSEGALRALLALLALLALVVVLYTAAALPPPPGVLAPAPVPPPVPLALAAHNMQGGHCPPPALLALEAPETLHMAAGLAPAGLHMTATRALVVVLHLEEGLLQAPLGLNRKK